MTVSLDNEAKIIASTSGVEKNNKTNFKGLSFQFSFYNLNMENKNNRCYG